MNMPKYTIRTMLAIGAGFTLYETYLNFTKKAAEATITAPKEAELTPHAAQPRTPIIPSVVAPASQEEDGAVQSWFSFPQFPRLVPKFPRRLTPE
jgi:hypothetical protein